MAGSRVSPSPLTLPHTLMIGMEHEEQILKSFFRRLTECRQKGCIHNTAYEANFVGSFPVNPPVTASCLLCIWTMVSAIASAKSSEGKTSGTHRSTTRPYTRR